MKLTIILSITIILCFFSITFSEDILDIINSDNENILREAIKKQNINGGIIYINTTIINIKEESSIDIKGDAPGGIIGIKQPSGEYPIISFEESRKIGSFYSLNVYGSNKYIKYLIIEKSGTNGIKISGKNHLFEHVISRYNQYAGIYLDSQANSNTFNYCFSYRNCDLKGSGKNGNGFYSNGAMNNNFNHCYSWDNSNNGFGFSSHELKNSILSYSHCASWNNGNANIFSGKYDYDNGAPLDRNMLTIQHLINSDNNFENNYNKKKFNIENCEIDGKNALQWISNTNSITDGNGFQFGFAYSPDVTAIKRIADLCVAFDHKSKGFDNNYSKKFKGYITNCVSFNNKINYQLPYIFEKWDNNWSWGATQVEQKDMDQLLKNPSKINSAQNNFYNVKNQIIKAVYANYFPDRIDFDNSIMSLD